MNPSSTTPRRCVSQKTGEYNALRCCLEAGHSGDHNYVIVRMPNLQKGLASGDPADLSGEFDRE